MPNIYDNEKDIFAYNNPVPTPIYLPRPITIAPTETPVTMTSGPSLSEYIPPSNYDLASGEKVRFQEPEYLDPSVANNLCLESSFDAISLLSDGYTYVFKDAYVYKFDNNFVMDKDYPRLVNSVFKVNIPF